MFGLALVLVAGFATGCKNQDQAQTQAPTQQPQTVVASSAGYQQVYVESQGYAEPTTENPDLVGYEVLSDGKRVEVVTYVHTYPDAIETYPRVYWGGNWYYNINGNFVYYSPYYTAWV